MASDIGKLGARLELCQVDPYTDQLNVNTAIVSNMYKLCDEFIPSSLAYQLGYGVRMFVGS